jgi:hypothetical protein
MWSGQYNTAAGETIRYLPRSRALVVGLPITDDWWLFDSKKLATMRFGESGEPLGGEIVTDPDVVAQHCTWWELAVAHSQPVPPAGVGSEGDSLGSRTPRLREVD